MPRRMESLERGKGIQRVNRSRTQEKLSRQLKPRLTFGLLLLAGVVCVLTGALFARMSSSDPLTTAAYRMTFALVLVFPFGVRKLCRECSSIPLRKLLLTFSAGGFLALHFSAWIYSLDYTSVTNSVCLVTTSSLWTGLIALIFLRKKPSSSLFWISCFLGLIGVVTLTGFAMGDNEVNLKGDGMALIGALCMAVYLLLVQGIKDRISFRSFLLLCYSSSMVFLWGFVVFSKSNPLPIHELDWIYLIGLAAISQVLGHGIYNWCVRWIDARMVALSLLGEPLGATWLAWIFLHESIGIQQLIGMAILLIALSLPSIQHLQSTKFSPNEN